MTTFYSLERSIAVGAVVAERVVVPPIVIEVKESTQADGDLKLFPRDGGWILRSESQEVQIPLKEVQR